MSWGTNTQITNALSLSNNIVYGNDSTAVALNPGETAEVQISCTFTGTATSDLYFRVIASNNGSNYDNIAFIAGSIGKVISTTQTRTILISGIKNFKIQYAQSVLDSQVMTINTYAIKNGISV